ncbi:hypothetical protein SAMN04488144_1012 [Methylobacterium sp. 190mf]|nr:hypothetical protein SAMN04488144_1012 [Methylobacterium sp. 190mf]
MQCSEVSVGIDVAKMRDAIAVADGERGGEVRYLGEIDAAPERMRRLVKRLAAEHARLHIIPFSWRSSLMASPPAEAEARYFARAEVQALAA